MRSMRGATHFVTVLLGVSALVGSVAGKARFDICGCEGHPDSLGAFDTKDESTWPPGTSVDRGHMTIPLPADGVLIFDSFNAVRWKHDRWHRISFMPNPANTAVTLLVAGDVMIGERVSVAVDGQDGGLSDQYTFGRGGRPGPAGFRGGDGASLALNGANEGGAGLGPGGGASGTAEPLALGGAGRFAGRRDLRPLLGGSGGGGGASKAEGNCAGSGGGGGGGAILIASNGTIQVDGSVNADGAHAGAFHSDSKCASRGGPGSGGAIRLLAEMVTGKGWLSAKGNRGDRGGTPGVIRIESIKEDTMRRDHINPPAIRSSVIAPLVNPIASTVVITAIGDQAVPEALTGSTGGVDVLVPAPGEIKLQVETEGVPAGTLVEVSLKPRVGGGALLERAELNPSACDKNGKCTAFVTFDLPSGAYFAEAVATFQTP